MRIVFCGTPEFSVAPLQKLIENKMDVVAVYTQPDRGVGRGRKVQYSAVKQCALDNSIEVYQPNTLKDEVAISELKKLQPDLLIVVAYGLILPQSILDIPTISCWNIHASLLPRWRGAAPIHRAILAGDKKTGVGIMQMEAGLDTGAVYVQHQCAIAKDETSSKLHDKLAIMGANAIIESIELLQQDLLPEPMKQDRENVTYAHKLEKSESLIDWSQGAEEIDKKIRALIPWPGIVANIQGEDYKIWQACIVDTKINSVAGEINKADKESLIIQCGKGLIGITEIQKAGKKRMDIKQFMQSKVAWYK